MPLRGSLLVLVTSVRVSESVSALEVLQLVILLGSLMCRAKEDVGLLVMFLVTSPVPSSLVTQSS